MKEKWNVILYLLWFSYLIISAIIMFGNGFLLSRKTLSDTSECLELNKFGCDGREIEKSSEKTSCNEFEKIKRIVFNAGAPMACPKLKNRVVFLLVDALRFDFTDYNPSLESPLYYQNRLPIIREILEKWPEQARLYRFMADPPTTTFQRVKALATGSLPTFIDITSNFAVMELQEDNFVDQVIKGDGKVVLLGDDTWTRLLPGKWKRSHALYSFHTWDLDTVDMEVDSKIYDELEKDDWQLLIAHYLGVDHAGHRYGPNHPEMARKLDETNNRIKKIIENLPKDVILYVVGDHGMTETGDHGGESKAERTAALFAYRGAGFAGHGASGAEVQQTDLAATLSAALGRPPPAPSLGNLLLPVLPPMPVPDALLQLSNNLKQLTQYLVRYGEESQQVPLEKLAQWINSSREQIQKAAHVDTQQELDKYAAEVRSLIVNIKGVFREVWVEFDSLSMLRALLLLLLAVFLHWLVAEGLPPERLPAVLGSGFVRTAAAAVGGVHALCGAAWALRLLERHAPAAALGAGLASGAVVAALLALHWGGVAQRWAGARTPRHERLARAALAASAAVLLTNSYIIEEGAALAFLALSAAAAGAAHVRSARAALLWLALGATLAASRAYRGCREEQGACWTAAARAGPPDESRTSLVAALAAVGAVVALCRRRAGRAGLALAAGGVLAGAHWAAGWRGLGSPARARQLARGAWLAVAGGALLALRRGVGPAHAVTQLVLLLFVCCALALGPALAPAAALALLAGYLALCLLALLGGAGGTKLEAGGRYGMGAASLWALLASYQFYGTGHHATLAHVRWAPAFHAGDPGDTPLGPPVIAALVALELFGMQFMYGVAVPLLALWGKNSASTLSPRSQVAAIFSVCLKFGLCFAIRLFAIAMSATIHCRHLMIWGVFTPKLLFEAGACGAALAGCVLGAALALWHVPAPSAHKAS